MNVTKLRRRTALGLLGAAIVLNVIILVRGEEAPGLPLAAIVLLSASGISLLAQRRPWQ